MTNNQLWLKLAFLGVAAVMLIVCGVLIATGHDGAITNTFLGVGTAFTGANIWSLLNKGDGSGSGSSGS